MRATIVQSGLLRTNARYRPSPTLFSFPGLRGLPVWPTNFFAEHAQKLQTHYDAILDEYRKIEKMRASDYLEGDHALINGKWDWHSYALKGRRQADFAALCPTTTSLLESFSSPRLMLGTPFSYAFFSTLHPGSKISPHSAPCNLRVRCHFPLVVPQNVSVEECGMRVGEETLQWKAGEPIFFDDAFEHEVWNSSDQARVVLLFDLW